MPSGNGAAFADLDMDDINSEGEEEEEEEEGVAAEDLEEDWMNETILMKYFFSAIRLYFGQQKCPNI